MIVEQQISILSPILTPPFWRFISANMPVRYANFPFSDLCRSHEILLEGIPTRFVSDLQNRLRLGVTDFALAVSISRRTFERRMELHEPFTLSEGERVVRIGRLLRLAEDVFESDRAAAEWLVTRQPIFAGVAPLALAATEPGARMVEQALGRIEHGVFA